MWQALRRFFQRPELELDLDPDHARGVKISAIWLRTVGGDENGAGATLEVLAEIGGRWYLVIEGVDGAMNSHIAEARGFLRRPVPTEPGPGEIADREVGDINGGY